MRNPFIEKVKVAIPELGDIFGSEITLKNGLNLISGENGTFKTRFLWYLKTKYNNGELVFFYDNIQANNFALFSPKRNQSAQKLNEMIETMRRDTMTSPKLLDKLRATNIRNEKDIVVYPSFPELFNIRIEDLVREGHTTKIDAVRKVKDDFQLILDRVFPGYEIIASWTDNKLVLNIKKQNGLEFSVDDLSCGEREVFSLIFNIYVHRDGFDVFLVDEPEIHLNWSLESNLFNFLKWFSEEHKKQVVVATHSKAIFQKDFIGLAQFFVWDSNKIKITNTVTSEIKDAIGGEAINLITSLDSSEKLFFVEDGAHKLIIEKIINKLNKSISVCKAGNSGTVKGLCRVAREQGLSNSYFVIDGDNEGFPVEFSGYSNLIKLSKYCIENYLLDFDLLAGISGKTVVEIKNEINEIIKSKNDQRNKPFKVLADSNLLVDNQELLDTFDASFIFGTSKLHLKLGLPSFEKLVTDFIDLAETKGTLNQIFSELINEF